MHSFFYINHKQKRLIVIFQKEDFLFDCVFFQLLQDYFPNYKLILFFLLTGHFFKVHKSFIEVDAALFEKTTICYHHHHHQSEDGHC